ncbi:MAG: 50S ribosomal protein L10 [Ardenticatenaceae bacterium]|nr:50S ribosomal protein L10 [Ardenticatenaceae bacterium]
MAISKERKDELVAQYADLIDRSSALFMAEYSGMDVKAMNDLRTKVYDANGALYVTKNTLLQLALQKADRPAPPDFLNGQLATGFALDEVPAMAKVLVDYAKTQEKFTLKGGMLGAEFLTAAQVEALAELPSLPEVRAQLLGLISAPARNVASVIASGMRQVVNVIDAYSKKEDEN